MNDLEYMEWLESSCACYKIDSLTELCRACEERVRLEDINEKKQYNDERTNEDDRDGEL